MKHVQTTAARTLATVVLLAVAGGATAAELPDGQEIDAIEAEAITLAVTKTNNYDEFVAQLNHCYEEFDVDMTYTDTRSVDKEREALQYIAQVQGTLPEADQQDLKFFMTYNFGTISDKGAGQRASALLAWQELHSTDTQMPETREEWEQALRISNGRELDLTDLTEEQEAMKGFTDIYLRVPNFENENDDLAIQMMVYGIQPDVRDLTKEAIALSTYTAVYQALPSTNEQWNKVRAIAYSGATR